MKVSAYLLPLDIIGNSPMMSTAQPAKGACGISRCNGLVLTLFGWKCTHNFTSSNVLVNALSHSWPPEVSAVPC